MEALFTEFIKERKYLKGISPRTEYSYNNTQRSLFHLHRPQEGEELTLPWLKAWVLQMRSHGLSPGAINVYVRTGNAFLNWLHTEKGHPRLKLPQVKEEKRLLPTLSPQQISALQRSPHSRLRSLALLALDTGLRVEELLTLPRGDVDLDALTLKVRGKGGKFREVPISLEGRKVLYRHLASGAGKEGLVFCTKMGGRLSQRNLLRDFKSLCESCGITGPRCSFHTLRHTMAVTYLRSGGNLEYLRRILGHSSILTTQKYLRSLGVEDLREVHSSLSPLSPSLRSR